MFYGRRWGSSRLFKARDCRSTPARASGKPSGTYPERTRPAVKRARSGILGGAGRIAM